MLPHAVALGDEEMISICLSDKLHQPYRFPLIPGSGDVRRIAEDLGCKAFCISGAGPSLLCLTRDAAFCRKALRRRRRSSRTTGRCATSPSTPPAQK